MGYAFISYSSINQESADSMREMFNKHNIHTWMAPYDIPAGSSYMGEINRALAGCDCLVLMLSDAAQNSQWVIKEVERAVSYKKTIIPVQIEDIILNDDFEFVLGSCHVVAVRKIDENSDEVKKVLNAVSACARDKYKAIGKTIDEKIDSLVETEDNESGVVLNMVQGSYKFECCASETFDSETKNGIGSIKDDSFVSNVETYDLWEAEEESDGWENEDVCESDTEVIRLPSGFHKDYENYMNYTIELQKNIWDGFETQIKNKIKEEVRWNYDLIKMELYNKISKKDNTVSDSTKYEHSVSIIGRHNIKLSDEWIEQNRCHIEFIEKNLPSRYNGSVVLKRIDGEWDGFVTIIIYIKKSEERTKKELAKEFLNSYFSSDKEERLLPIKPCFEHSYFGEYFKSELSELAEKDKLKIVMQPCFFGLVNKDIANNERKKKKYIKKEIKKRYGAYFQVSLIADNCDDMCRLNEKPD